MFTSKVIHHRFIASVMPIAIPLFAMLVLGGCNDEPVASSNRAAPPSLEESTHQKTNDAEVAAATAQATWVVYTMPG